MPLSPTLAHLKSAVSATLSKQWGMRKEQRKTKKTKVRVCGKAELWANCLTAWASKAVGTTVKMAGSNQASERATMDGGITERLFATFGVTY